MKSRFYHRPWTGHFYLATTGHYYSVTTAGEKDLVVGLPDLYPNQEYRNTRYKHDDLSELQHVQRNEVHRALVGTFNLTQGDARNALTRFRPSALKHDLEMLLLAAKDRLRSYLGTGDQLGNWRSPVEDQNQDHPPRGIVEDLFRTKSRGKRVYRGTRDARAVLARVTNIKEVLYDERNQVQCPAFKAMLDSIGVHLGVTAYS